MKHRRFSKRENILIIIMTILLLMVGYYQIFLRPLQDNIALKQEEIVSLQSSIEYEVSQAQQLSAMQAQLNAIESGTLSVAPLPLYDNINNVVNYLDAVLAASQQYSLTFNPVVLNDSSTVVGRPINMVFLASNYDTARAIIFDLYNSPYRCLITNANLTAGSPRSGGTAALPNSAVTVNLTVTFLEQLS